MDTATAIRVTGRTEDHHISAAKSSKTIAMGKTRRRKPVSATKAKTLNEAQFRRLLDLVGHGKHPKRDTVMVMLSYFCGLRAQEIAGVRWKRNILKSDGKVGDVLHVTEDIGKRIKERFIPMNAELRAALRTLRAERPKDKFVVHAIFGRYANSKRAEDLEEGQTHPNTMVKNFERLYAECAFVGCTSHSGRRTAGTNWARHCNTVGASLRDVQDLLGHASLKTTQDYIEVSPNQHKLVEMMF